MVLLRDKGMVDTVLVTGAAGFIGNKLVKALEKNGFKVKAFVRNSSTSLEGVKAEIIEGDVRNYADLKKAVKGAKQIVHLAVKNKGSRRDINKTNITGLKNLLKAAHKNKIEHVLFYSSVAVYGEQLNVTEEFKFDPYDDYGKSKVDAEKLISAFKKKSELPVTIFRPSHVYGPGGKSNILSLFKFINKRMYTIFGSGENLVNMAYIDDVTNVTIKILKNKKNWGDDYIISGPKPYSQNAMTEIIADMCGVRKPLHLPYFLGYSIGTVLDILSILTRKKLPLSRRRVKNLSRGRSFIINKAQKKLSYQPRISFEKGAKLSYDWYKDNKLL